MMKKRFRNLYIANSVGVLLIGAVMVIVSVELDDILANQENKEKKQC